MSEDNKQDKPPEKQTIYSNVKIPIKVLDGVIIGGIILMILVILFFMLNG